jgi:hypothetical protein
VWTLATCRVQTLGLDLPLELGVRPAFGFSLVEPVVGQDVSPSSDPIPCPGPDQGNAA